MKEHTCGNCKHLVKVGSRNWIFGCERTGSVVPHSADYSKDEIIFWRVPVECPRPDSEVVKSQKQAPKKVWVHKTTTDFTEVKDVQ